MNRLMALAGLLAMIALPALAGGAGGDTDVPEPASLALLAAGVGGLLLAKHRRRK